MKRVSLVKVLILSTLAILSAACIKDNSKDPKSQKVVVLLPDDSIIDRWASDRQNLKTVMDKYGFNTTFYTAPETEEGAVEQVNQLKKVIQDGANYIVLTAIDHNLINESGLLDRNPDVKVVCHDRLVLNNPHIAYVSSTDTKEIGRLQAIFLLNHFHSTGADSMTIEILEGPETDFNAKEYYEGAMELLKKYIDDGKKDMQNRLESYGEGECPDMVLAANDNLAQGAIEALEEAGITAMPVITGQDNTAMAKSNIKNHKQAMTIDKNLKDMAYNTALIINSLISGSPVQTSQSIFIGTASIPALYSKTSLMTIDSY